MSPELLRTKLFVPQVRTKHVSRPQLVDRLQAWMDRKLILVSAPAGFGKTTLLSEWIDARSLKSIVAWVSLASTDNDPFVYWSYIVAALQTVEPRVGIDILQALQSAQPPPVNPLIEELINELASITRSLILILDDYHVINDPQINQSMEMIVEHLPQSLHLVISSRADPPWLLGQMRARMEVLEFRTDDLRFNPEEVKSFLTNVMDLGLTGEMIAALDMRTEGWIAGLQLAALSMQGRSPEQFIATFSGSNRYILDFLVEEVLMRQRSEARDFLLKTSILSSLTAPLCDEVVQIENSHKLLKEIESANLFVIPLDLERQWYRYHQLFADLLSVQLSSAYPDQVPQLHQRASGWLEERGHVEDALRHAYAAEDYPRVANLIEKYGEELLHQSKHSLLSKWIESLPDDLVKTRPWLCVYKSWTRHWAGLREGGEKYLDYAELSLDRDLLQPEALSGADLGDFSVRGEQLSLAGTISAVRAHYAVIEEDVPRAVEEALQALELLPEKDYFTRSTAAVALGAAYWGLGDVQGAEKAFSDCASNALKGGYKYRASSAFVYLGMQQVKQGRLFQAEETFKEALRLAEGPGGRRYPNAGYALIKLAELASEWNHLEQARELVDEGVELCAQLGHVDLLAEAYIALARVQLAEGGGKGVLASMNEVERISRQSKLDAWILAWLDDCRVRYWLSTGQFNEADQWIKSCGLRVDDEFNYHHELEHINLARLLISRGIRQREPNSIKEGIDLLDRLLDAAQSAGWVYETIRIMVLQSIALEAAEKGDRASEILAKALVLAEPGGYVRTFIQEGPQIKNLLERLSGAGEYRIYALRLLSALEVEGEVTRKTMLYEELTDREMEVLRLLVTHLPVPDIADELYVSVHTVRSHVKSIYNKLNVHSRIAAVERARELHLV